MHPSFSEKKIVTECFLLREGEILLGLKKRGFGKGKWHGIGGKVEKGETIPAGAVREIAEEIHVLVGEDCLEKQAEFLFRYFEEGRAVREMEAHIYFVREWEGEPSESDEMFPKWHKLEEIPFGSMWEDNLRWLPRVLSGEKLKGTFSFHGEAKKMGKFEIVPGIDK